MRNLEIQFDTVAVSSPVYITCRVTKDSKNISPDFGDITIYNLSKETRSLIVKEKTKIKVFGGHDDVTDLIFTGDIQQVTHYKNATEWITNILAGDGHLVMKQALINKTYSQPTQLRTIIQDTARALTGQLPEIIGDLLDIKPGRGVTLSGSVAKELEKYAKTIGMRASVQNDRVVVGAVEAARPAIGFNVNVNTGMIGIPEWVNVGEDNDLIEGIKGRRIKVRSLLIPGIRPFDRVRIKSNYIQTDFDENLDHEFVVIRVEHDLNNREGNFQTIIEGISL